MSLFALKSLAVFAEILIGLDLVSQFPDNEFNHDCVVQKAQSWDMVGYQIFGLGEVGKRMQNAGCLLMRQTPFDIGQHADHQFELLQAIDDESGYRSAFDIFEQFFGRGHDILWWQARRRLSGLLHDQPEVLQIVFVEFERNSQ